MRLLTLGVVTAAIVVSGCQRTSAAPARPVSAKVLEPVTNSIAPDTSSVVAAENRSARLSTHEVVLPAGTRLPIVLDDAVGSDISRVEQPVRAHLSSAIRRHGETVLPQGSRVTGVVTDARRSAKVKGRAHVALRFDSLIPRGDDERHALHASTIGRAAPGTKKDDSLKIGLPAAGGAIVGGLLGGKKGAVIGGAAGGGAGTAVVLSTRGKEVRLPRGTPLTIRLTQPLTLRIRD